MSIIAHNKIVFQRIRDETRSIENDDFYKMFRLVTIHDPF